ncbi:MAG: hypothetical protein F4X44_00710 [Gammaproteobacteria bacterium]|nr:hypothetical protein [Gammaproteobacteria bacterium]MYD79124.1 hypothetical protein [Gammaproteobacteria bacterium]
MNQDSWPGLKNLILIAFQPSLKVLAVSAFLSATLTASVCQAHESATSQGTGGTLDIKIAGDFILARVELVSEVWFKDTHIVLDLSMPEAMMINPSAGLRFGSDEATLKVRQENFDLEISRSRIVNERGSTTSDLTARYDNFLNQIDVLAIVGWPVLHNFGLTLDIQEKKLVLHPQEELEPDEVRNGSDVFVEGLEIIGSSLFIPVNYSGGQSAFMKFKTSGYHTVLNRELLDDRESGVLDEAYFGFDESLKVSDMAALFPQDLYTQWWNAYSEARATEKLMREQFEQEGRPFPEQLEAKRPDQPSGDVLLIAGLSVLAGYRWVLDPHQGFVGVTRTLNSNYSEADHQFYMASVSRDVDELFKFMENNPESRHVEEAVSQVFAIGMESGIDEDRLVEAIQFGMNVNEERRQFMYVLDYLFGLAADEASLERNTELIIALGKLSLPMIARSESPRFRQHVQLLLGDRYLAQNDPEQALRFFMSAAFNSDPALDSRVSYELGRAYEALGRDRRAYASYDKATSLGLPPDLSKNANEALSRIRIRLDPNDELLEKDTEEG